MAQATGQLVSSGAVEGRYHEHLWTGLINIKHGAKSHHRSMNDVRLLRRHQAGKGTAYIKISESEIANDYPEPAQYEKVHTYQPVSSWVPEQLHQWKRDTVLRLCQGPN